MEINILSYLHGSFAKPNKFNEMLYVADFKGRKLLVFAFEILSYTGRSFICLLRITKICIDFRGFYYFQYSVPSTLPSFLSIRNKLSLGILYKEINAVHVEMGKIINIKEDEDVGQNKPSIINTPPKINQKKPQTKRTNQPTNPTLPKKRSKRPHKNNNHFFKKG